MLHTKNLKELDKLPPELPFPTCFIVEQPKSEALPDRVNKPDHYNHTDTGIECIDAIKAATGDLFEGYLQGNIIKYLWRYRYKNDVEDIHKAQVYTKWLEDERKEKGARAD